MPVVSGHSQDRPPEAQRQTKQDIWFPKLGGVLCGSGVGSRSVGKSVGLWGKRPNLPSIKKQAFRHRKAERLPGIYLQLV